MPPCSHSGTSLGITSNSRQALAFTWLPHPHSELALATSCLDKPEGGSSSKAQDACLHRDRLERKACMEAPFPFSVLL